MKDVLLSPLDDLDIAKGDFVVNESLTQDVGIILRLNQGDLKSDPLLGPNLISQIKSAVNNEELQRSIKIHLERDNKDYDELKQFINTNTNQL